MLASTDRYRTTDRITTHNGEAVRRDRAPIPDKAEKLRRKEQRDTEAKVALAEHKDRDKARRANMERLKAERLARDDR